MNETCTHFKIEKNVVDIALLKHKLVVIKDYESAFDAVTLIQIP